VEEQRSISVADPVVILIGPPWTELLAEGESTDDLVRYQVATAQATPATTPQTRHVPRTASPWLPHSTVTTNADQVVGCGGA
jgi:hypothetical protein